MTPRSAPSWFGAALAHRPQHAGLVVEDARVHFRTWGTPGDRATVLVHGAGGHSGWWDHIAPQLGGRVVAVDLTGHGDSGHRTSYDLRQWGREVRAVVEAEGLDTPAIVGHSMGGRVAVAAATAGPSRAVVCIDSPVFPVTRERGRRRSPARPARVHPSRRDAILRFRPVPDQPVLDYVAAHVADQSVRAVDGGWTWKSDAGVFGLEPTLRELLTELDPTTPLAFLRSSAGVVGPDMMEALLAARQGRVAVVDLPDTGHHPMLDRPQELVGALREALAERGPTDRPTI